MSNKSRATLLDATFAAAPTLLQGGPGPRPDDHPLSHKRLCGFIATPRSFAFADALESVGNCAHPIRVRGSSTRIDAETGEVLSAFCSADKPDGVTYLRCGSRDPDYCPSCARLYAGDMFQMIRAGISGGKTVPERVRDNPLVFATLTAPSFGRVHTRRDNGTCHPRTRGSERCPHGQPRSCTATHGEDDELLGQPLCPDCYDYDSQVVWQWWAPDLFRRFTIALRRSIARDLGIPRGSLADVAMVQYAKVGEDQERAVVHFHALIRLDGPKTDEGFAPAPPGFDPARLARHVESAARSVRMVVPGVDANDPDRVLAFGRQIDTKPVKARRRPDDPSTGLDPEQVAGYLAKYATKTAAVSKPTANAHHRRLRSTCAALARRASTTEDSPYELMHKWVRKAGWRGHFSSKSRRYSITLGALRRARRRAQALIAESNRTGKPLDLASMEAELLSDEDSATTRVLSEWEFDGVGWNSDVERELAIAAAGRAREYDQWKAEQRRSIDNHNH